MPTRIVKQTNCNQRVVELVMMPSSKTTKPNAFAGCLKAMRAQSKTVFAL